MPKSNNLDRTLKSIHKVADNASSIGAVAGLFFTAVSFVVKVVNNRESKIDVSAICSAKGHPMTINEAREYLEKVEVKSISIPIKISEADPRYRDCFEFQVVDVKPSTKISPDEILQVYYITREVIDKSQRLFEELDKKNKQSNR